MPGKTTAPALWYPSAEQIVQTVHSHLLFSPWYIVCALAFHSARKVALWAYKQTVQKRASQPLLFPGELAFLFRLQAVKDLESWCRCPELIALSWSKLHGLPNVQKMFINNASSRILASSCPLLVAFICLPTSHPRPLGAGGVGGSPLSAIVIKFRIALDEKITTYTMGCVWWTSLFWLRKVPELQKLHVWAWSGLGGQKTATTLPCESSFCQYN